MHQLQQLLAKLSLRQKITIGAVAVAVIGGLIALSYWNKERDFKPLFTSLAPEDAGQVVTKIREAGVDYRLSENGGTVLVPSGKVAEIRLQLAASGLPKSGRIGFELFDKTNFGATDFAEQINYHRALEGELERSVMALAEVETARVHITFPKESIYTESKQAAKASVLIKLHPGSRLSPQNVLAICHLASSAVEGLLPEGVSVLDMNGNLLNRPRRAGPGDGAEPSEALIDFRRQLEKDLVFKINGTLDPLLGAEKYRVGASIDCDFSTAEQSEESFDPTKSVMVTSQRTEDGVNAANSAGVPGAASNLPRPTSRPVSGAAGSSRRTENISYQTSRVVKHVKLPQGNVKRVSISILLDQAVRFDKGKRIIDPPPPEKLKIVKDLVAGIVGLQPDRGDQIVVETFPFDATLNLEPPALSAPAPAAPALPWAPAWLQKLMQEKKFPMLVGIGAAVVLVLVAGGVWLFTRGGKKGGKKGAAAMASELAAGTERKAIAAPDVEKELQSKLSEHAALKEKQTLDAVNALKLGPVKTKKAEVLAKHISSEAKKDPGIMAQVVRSWLNDSDR